MSDVKGHHQRPPLVSSIMWPSHEDIMTRQAEVQPGSQGIGSPAKGIVGLTLDDTDSARTTRAPATRDELDAYVSAWSIGIMCRR
jgi:hypothetical protein